jgi:hypothetical protein
VLSLSGVFAIVYNLVHNGKHTGQAQHTQHGGLCLSGQLANGEVQGENDCPGQQKRGIMDSAEASPLHKNRFLSAIF